MRASCTMEDGPICVAVCFRVVVRSDHLPSILFHLLAGLGNKRAALHRRSWVSAFLDLADMGGGGSGRFFLEGWRITCMVHFLVYQRFILELFLLFAEKRLSVFYISFFSLEPQGCDCYWKGHTKRGLCSKRWSNGPRCGWAGREVSKSWGSKETGQTETKG